MLTMLRILSLTKRVYIYTSIIHDNISLPKCWDAKQIFLCLNKTKLGLVNLFIRSVIREVTSHIKYHMTLDAKYLVSGGCILEGPETSFSSLHEEFLFLFFIFLKKKADMAAPKHRRQLTTLQVSYQIEKRSHNQEWNRISPPSSSSLRSSRTKLA